MSLQAELEQILESHNEALLAVGAPPYPPELTTKYTLKAILATVSRHLPEPFALDNDDYTGGYNSAITEMEKILGGNI